MDYIIAMGIGFGIGIFVATLLLPLLLYSQQIIRKSKNYPTRLMLLLGRMLAIGLLCFFAIYINFILVPKSQYDVSSEFTPIHAAVLCCQVPMLAATLRAASILKHLKRK